jgi:ABC-2 type transport system permease protein
MKINRHRVWVIIEKEWSEFRQSKMLLALVALAPLLIALVLVGIDCAIVWSEGAEIDVNQAPIPQHLQHLDPLEAQMIQINEQLLLAFLLIPTILPSYIAAYTIIGEKQARTLEPVLATPISTWELLAGKGIAAASPAILLTWISYAVALGGLKLTVPPTVFAYTSHLTWVLAMALLSPLTALLSTLFGVIVSSRTNDPRTAQQVTAILVTPFIASSLAQLTGLILVSVPVVLLAALVTLLIDLTVLYFAVKLFRRETILTRWK